MFAVPLISSPFLLILLLLLLNLGTPILASSSSLQDPHIVVQDVHKSINASRRNLGYLSCATGNPIDDCWRCDPNWESNRQRLADCAIGFGKNAMGGKGGRIYVVTDSGNDDPVNPRPGTLRHAVIQDEPLWIIFKRDMVIRLNQELVMNSHKTIDGRGASVHIAGGACITIHHVTNIIIHGIHIHDCVKAGNGIIRDSPEHKGWWEVSDGDGISIFGVGISGWIIVLFRIAMMGHSDEYTQDKNMQVTIAFNHFGEGLVQRMPRCRHGYFHVVNNDYTHWEMYAIGGSASPTIYSQGNSIDTAINFQVTKHEDAPESEWRHWNWRSEGDLMMNGAYFLQSGAGAWSTYARASSLSARPSSLVGSITTAAGALNCRRGTRC
ncbi:UNVERIFIED_CONTAM: Pectate lyase [Sesamum calycinum]|uniref:Pectate lyase n=1 Tax=Sesamum calycinum TaxID=2727403 RepID=A0AAW2ST30_9LAMI